MLKKKLSSSWQISIWTKQNNNADPVLMTSEGFTMSHADLLILMGFP